MLLQRDGLIDSRFKEVRVPENAYSERIRHIHSTLHSTCLDKVARPGSPDAGQDQTRLKAAS